MSTVEEIKTAIDELPLEDRAALVADLCGWEDDAWDRQMKADSVMGKFDGINRDAVAAHAAGHATPLNRILREP